MRKHPQTVDLTQLQPLADQLKQIDPDKPMACSDWHTGLLAAYASDRIGTFLGSPLSKDPAAITAELNSAGVRVYLRMFPNAYVPHWRLVHASTDFEIYENSSAQ